MKNLSKNLLIRLLVGIAIGILVGYIKNNFIIRTLATFNVIFGALLSFTIPLLILAFVTYGIAQLGKNSRKILGLTLSLSYLSTISVGMFVFFFNRQIFPSILTNTMSNDIFDVAKGLDPYFSISIPPLMSVMTALILAFILGIGISIYQSNTLKSSIQEFHQIISSMISTVIIPFLPLYIAGVFANVVYSGQSTFILGTFIKVFGVVIALHIFIILVQYTIAGIISKKNPLTLLKNMMPAYLTAIGTQSSAATIPVTVESIKKNNVKSEIAEFVASLCANIHMSGSMTTLVSCSLAVLLLSNMTIPTMEMIGFVLLLGIMMVAAPGLPGGAVLAAAGILQSNLGFTESMTALIITLYLAQDSFGTACNVTGDGAIAILIDHYTETKIS